MSIVFKLKYRDIIRRIALTQLPKWDVLAEKLSSVFLIPMTNVGVSYVDADGDEITLNSQEELDDFYRTTYRYGESIKFAVKDLLTAQSVSRSSTSHEFAFHHPLPPPPPPFPPGFLPRNVHPYPELTLSYGIPPPPLPPPPPPLHHHQGTWPPPSTPHCNDQAQDSEEVHEPHGSHGRYRHHRHLSNGAFRWHHHAPPPLPSLSVTLWGPHGPPPPPLDHFPGHPRHHPHPGSPGVPPDHHPAPHSSHTSDSHLERHSSSDRYGNGTHANTEDAEKLQD